MNIFQMLQVQMNRERQNEVAYEAMALVFEFYKWDGFATWMHKAAEDEHKHYRLFADYLNDRGQVPTLTALNAPEPSSVIVDLRGPAITAMFQSALDLEIQNTDRINALSQAAYEDDDPQTCTWLYSWAIAEQTRSVRDLTDRVQELTRQDAAGLLILDHQYGEE